MSYSPDLMSGLGDLSNYYSGVQGMESSGNPNATNPNSSAGGLNQFLDGTYNDVLARHPEIDGPTDKNDPRVMQAFTQDNAKVLQQNLGRTPNQVDLYAAHVLGATGATRFLSADPNTPVTQVVSPEAVRSNPHFFYDKAGNERTVGQVYAEAAQGLKMPDTQMPSVSGGGITSRIPGSYNVASTGNGIPPPPSGLQMSPGSGQPSGSLFPSAESIYGPQSDAIKNYIAGQPGMWDKLAQMQADYKKAAAPTMQDKLDDNINSFNQLNSAAQANLHANAGGILFGQNPDASDFIKALQAQHGTDLQARQQRLDLAKTGYDQGSAALLAQNQQGAVNLGLTGALAKDQADYGLNTGKITIELQKFGLDQQKAFMDQLEKLVPNPDTRAQIAQQFIATANPNASYAQNMKTLTTLISQAQTGGSRITGEAPNYQDISIPDGKGSFKTDTVDISTPEGRAKYEQYKKDGPQVASRNINVPEPTNITTNNNNNNGGDGSHGANGPLTMPQLQMSAIQMKSNVEAAKTLLQYISQSGNGGTGTISGSPLAMSALGILKQVGIADADTLPAREVFKKLMATIQNQQTQADLRSGGGTGRGGFAMFAQINKGNLDDTANNKSIATYLDHVGNVADYTQNKAETLQQAEQAALENRTPNFNLRTEEMTFNKSHPYPQWHTDDLTPPATTPAPAGSVQDPVTKEWFRKGGPTGFTKIAPDDKGVWGDAQ